MPFYLVENSETNEICVCKESSLYSQIMFAFLLRRPWIGGTSFGTLGTILPFTDPTPPPAKGASIKYLRVLSALRGVEEGPNSAEEQH